MTKNNSGCVSFVIPAFNEEKSIGITLQSIVSGEMKLPYEIIVVDHNSKDRTAGIAQKYGANVITAKCDTIAGVRNLGVKKSNGDILIFLDADVSLTEQWFGEFTGVVDQLFANPMMLTGSHCHAPDNGSWIEKSWFNNYVHEVNADNIGSGHMIVLRELFESVNGFDESLETGEDYAFCMKVIRVGGDIRNNPLLHVIHRDYPKSSWQFIKREAWHGMGDVASLTALMQSKVAIAALFFIAFHVTLLSAFFIPSVPNELVGLSIAGIVGLLLYSAWKKFGHCGFTTILKNSVIFYLYFIGRSFSFAKIIGRKMTSPT